MQPLQLSDEILLLALLPLCPLPCVLQLAAVARRTGPGQLTTHDLLRRCVDLRERVLTALLPVLWAGLRCPPFRGVRVPLLQFGGHHSGDFAHAVAARLASAPECGPHVARQLCCAESTELARRPRTPPGGPIFRGDSEVFLPQWLAANTDSVAGETLAAFLRRRLWLGGHYGETTLVLVFAVENCEGALVFPISAAAGDWPDVAAL